MSGLWIFEVAEPEVGFMTDTITHDCEANEDAQGATSDSRLIDQPGGETVHEIILFTCPACSATTTVVETWPRWMFDEGVHLPDWWDEGE